MPDLESTTPDEAPDESVALRLNEILVEAYLACHTKDEGLEYLQCLAHLASEREEMRRVVQIKRTGQQDRRALTERQALAALRDMLEVWMARLRT